ncbi:MAG: hypothetical protein QNK05_00235 [Myxococcota bacterium]|nr:hypothetical protein [Myxococcota bacterium]
MLSFDYEIDADDRLTAVSDAWLAFARDNQAAALTREAVLDEPLWRFIVGTSTRHLYELLFDEVRSRGRRFVLPMRCDSPWRRRFMELEIEPGRNDFIRLRCRLLREEERAAHPLLDPSSPRSADTVEACSFCKRLRANDESWLDLEAAIVSGDLLDRVPQPQLTHVVCPDCEERVQLSLKRA